MNVLALYDIHDNIDALEAVLADPRSAASTPERCEGDGAARWLWVADGEPSLRRTPYDAAAAGARMLAAGWPDEDSVRAALVEPEEPKVITDFFEDMARH